MSLADTYREPHDNRFPALLGALVLHIGLFLAVTMWVHPSMIPVGSAVPINIVSSAPTTDTKPAEEAPQVQAAATETPVPEAPPAPPPIPTPAKPQPAKAAPPTPPKAITPIPQKTPPPKPVVTRPTPSIDLDALQASISRAAHAAPAKPSAAPRGPTRAETDLHARPDAGKGVSQSQLEGLQQLLGRLWNPNCQVEGGEDVRLRLTFTVAPDGQVAGSVSAGGAEHSDPVTSAAARRAIDAVHQVAPYAEPYRGQKIMVNFNAKEVCSNR